MGRGARAEYLDSCKPTAELHTDALHALHALRRDQLNCLHTDTKQQFFSTRYRQVVVKIAAKKKS